jgi:predicted DNA-binding ribbon-helix-helix protein
MPFPLKRVYRGPRRKDSEAQYVFRSIRMHPDLWSHLEIVAAREHVSMNSLVNALLALALEPDQTEDGRAAIHGACTQWRTRWEHAETARRESRIAADTVEEEAR